MGDRGMAVVGQAKTSAKKAFSKNVLDIDCAAECARIEGVIREQVGVPPYKTVAEAGAWKRSNEVFTVTPEEWSSMIIGIHQT